MTAPAQATFSVVATGTAPLSYQWRRNGAAIRARRAASYTLNPTALGDNGALFDVVVSNSAGNATSAAATLTVSSGGGGGTSTLIDAHFDTDADGFAYADDLFRGTNAAELRQRRVYRLWRLHRRGVCGARWPVSTARTSRTCRAAGSAASPLRAQRLSR